MTRKPRTKPQIGEVTIGTTTFQRMPLLFHQWSALGSDQMRTAQLSWAAAIQAPHSPPTSACDELEGSPNHHVSRFQKMAATRAQMRTSEVANSALTNPEAMVEATA